MQLLSTFDNLGKTKHYVNTGQATILQVTNKIYYIFVSRSESF